MTDERNRLYDALIRPRRVALVGASDTVGKVTARPLHYLAQRGWPGVAYPVNPRRESVAGLPAWPTLRHVPERPDHVYVMTDSDTALEAVEHCVELSVPVVTLIADGFVGNNDGGRARRERLQALVEGSSTRLLGPSSLGVAVIGDGLMLTANAAFADPDLLAGGVFVASQSGSAIGALATRGAEMGIGFRALVSTGNELDLSLGEICHAAVDDPQVSSFALFLENITHADALRQFARAAADRDKPVLAYKLGRSEAGARLAVSHTGALAGDDAVADALLADLGIARVSVFEALLEGQQLGRTAGWTQTAAGPRVCVVSTTGGGGAMAVDCLAQRGAQLRGPTPHTIQRLAEVGIITHGEALIDLTLAGTRYDVMKSALEILLSAPEFDAVVAVPGSSARFQPELAVKPIAECAHAGKPLAAFVVPAATEALRLLRDNDISAFRTPEACADAVMALCTRRRPTADRQPPRSTQDPMEVLDEVSSYEIIHEAGITPAPHAVVAADDLPSGLPIAGPVAVKLLSAQVPHKSDVGAVVLGVTDGAELAAAVDTIRGNLAQHAPQVGVERILLQSMVDGRAEALVGLRRDAHAGPVVVLASGGVLAELYRDRVVRIAPVDLPTARDMVAQIKAFRPLAGYRGGQRGDLEALAHAVVAISELADSAPDIVEAEVNPLFVGRAGEGVLAVDALVRRVAQPS